MRRLVATFQRRIHEGHIAGAKEEVAVFSLTRYLVSISFSINVTKTGRQNVLADLHLQFDPLHCQNINLEEVTGEIRVADPDLDGAEESCMEIMWKLGDDI